MDTNDKSFLVVVVDSESNISNYQESLKEITQSLFLYSENYLQHIDLIKQKKIDAVLINIKFLSEQQPRELNNIKRQFKEFNIPTFFFSLKLGHEINIESVLNTSIATPDSLLINDLILSIKEHYFHGERIEILKPRQEIVPQEENSKTNLFESNEINLQKSIFIRNITYEIRTLLNNVGGPIQLIKEKIDDPELIPFFGIIDSTLNRLVEFTFKATLNSDLKMGNYPIKKMLVNLDEIVRFSALELTEFLELEKIKLTVKTPDFKTNLYGDKDLLFHGFTAILDKIANLTRENGEIQIDFSKGEESIDCKITTSSIAFPKQDILKIFNSTSIEQEIGLALAKLVLNIHKGSYWVDLTKDTGITLGISFKTSDHE